MFDKDAQKKHTLCFRLFFYPDSVFIYLAYPNYQNQPGIEWHHNNQVH